MKMSPTDRLLALVAEYATCPPEGLHMGRLDVAPLRLELALIAGQVRLLEAAPRARIIPVTRPAPLLSIPPMPLGIPCLAANAP